MHAIFFSLGWRDPIGELRKLLGNRCRNGRLTKTFYKDGDGKSVCVWASKRSVNHAGSWIELESDPYVNSLNPRWNGPTIQAIRMSERLTSRHPPSPTPGSIISSLFFFLGRGSEVSSCLIRQIVKQAHLLRITQLEDMNNQSNKKNQFKGCWTAAGSVSNWQSEASLYIYICIWNV